MDESKTQPKIVCGSALETQNTQTLKLQSQIMSSKGRGLRLLQALENLKAQRPGNSATPEKPVRPKGRATFLEKNYRITIDQTTTNVMQNISNDTTPEDTPCKYEGEFEH